MLIYGLVKRLKQAGYPFQEIPYKAMPLTTLEGDPKTLRLDFRTTIVELDKIIYYMPTLSELIKTCGQKGRFVSLHERSHGWDACLDDWESKDYGGGYNYESGDEVVLWRRGKNPEAAVAKLYIALNKEP